MTEEKKQELKQLLNEAVENLEIRYGHEPIPLPVDVYRNYLQERWASYGIDFLSFSSFLTSLTPNIVAEGTKSNLLKLIREELALVIYGNDTSDFLGASVPVASYDITSYSENRSRLHCVSYQRTSLDSLIESLIERLLKIAIGKNIEEAVSFFDRYSCPDGAHGIFHMVTQIEGIEPKTEIQVVEGVRLVPLPSSEIPEQFARYLPSWLSYTLMDHANEFYGNALIVVDSPGFSILREPAPDPTSSRGVLIDEFQWRDPIDELPFPVEVHDVNFPNFNTELFYRALSLVCNSPVHMRIGEWISEPDKSLLLDDKITGLNIFLDPCDHFVEVEEADIEKAKCLYRILDTNPDLREKLRMPIDRWIKSKAPENTLTPEEPIDKIIDLGIVFEALYLSDVKEELIFRLGVRAAWYLGKDKTEREKLLKKFGDIYRCRSNAVHGGQLDEPVRFGEERISIRKFIERVQNLCRDSIMKILNSEQFPDRNYWDSLILGGEDEQASS